MSDGPDYARPTRRLIPRDWWHYAIFFAMLVILGVFLLYPIALTVRGAFSDSLTGGGGFTLDYFLVAFEDPANLTGLANAFLIATVTTVLCFVIALPLAILSARYTYPLKPVFNALILVPLILPPFVGAIGMQRLLGTTGGINSFLGIEYDLLGNAKFWGVVIVEALHLYPIIYLNATAALANLDPALDEAAENLGASGWRRLRSIVMPLIRPGLFAGGAIVFVWSLTELGTPLVFDFDKVTPVQIFEALGSVEDSPEPYVLTVVMLMSALMAYVLGKFVFGGRGHAMYSKASRAAGEVKLTGLGGVCATGAFIFVTALALLPHVGVVLTSLEETGAWYRTVFPQDWTLGHYERALTDDMASRSIKNSLMLSGAAVAANVIVGLMVAYVVVRTKVRGRALLDALCMLPLAVPGLVMAFGYVAFSIRLSDEFPIFGSNGLLNITVVGATPNPIPLLIIAYGIRRLPYVVRSAIAGLEQTSGELEEAAINLGAGRVTAVRKVIVPLIMANLIAGALLAFSFAMLEVSDSLILAQQPEDYPITRAIFEFLGRLGDGPNIASAMGVWGMALLTVTLVGASILIGKKLGAIFRV